MHIVWTKWKRRNSTDRPIHKQSGCKCGADSFMKWRWWIMVTCTSEGVAYLNTWVCHAAMYLRWWMPLDFRDFKKVNSETVDERSKICVARSPKGFYHRHQSNTISISVRLCSSYIFYLPNLVCFCYTWFARTMTISSGPEYHRLVQNPNCSEKQTPTHECY